MAAECDADPIEGLRQMFVDEVQRGRLARGQCPARRPVFLRLHGVAHGRLEVRDGLPDALRVGLFAEARSFPAWVRFSSDIPDQASERRSTVGLGIKLFEVPGRKLLPPDEDAPTADLILQNHDVFFVDDAKDMCAFTRASLSGKGEAWLDDHPVTRQILADMEKDVASVLGIDFHSVIALGFGEGQACKLTLQPAVPITGPASDDPDALATDLSDRLCKDEVRFRLLVQVSATLPTDRLTVRWTNAEAPRQHVATLILPRQDVTARGQATYGENLAFNPWHITAPHEPQGSIAAARRVVYQASADVRRDANGVPRAEPAQPRPVADEPVGDHRIVRCAIHPAIGVARVGDSPDDFYLGPEVADPPPAPQDGYRDASGRLQRQGARFRIYGYDADGNVVKELTAADAQIRWSAHLVNRKAAWFRFDRAMDIPEAVGLSVPRRNAKMTKDRHQLVIDPGQRTIAGASATPVPFDGGTFLGTEVYLGELRTDAAGRLIVLGGRGVSGSPTNAPIYRPEDPQSFNNADGWHDDTGDGPVCATVVVGGRAIPCEPAWVIVAPPDFAPDLKGWRTMYDLRVDVARTEGMLPLPDRPSFSGDILPILQRLSGLQWVNAGFAAYFGADGALDFQTDQALIRKLARAPGTADPYRELRRTVANSFRAAAWGEGDPGTWPWIYGDGFGTADNSLPQENLTLPPTWAHMLDQWADGSFEADWDPSAVPKRHLADVPVAEQPAMLDRAALDFCLADAFHPGCEITWPMRHQSLFTSPFRIRHAPPGSPAPDLGSTLTQDSALAVGGPLYAQRPGDLTRWMALPWQMDTAFCRSGYDTDYDPYLPTFWPARVPNQVLTQDAYAVLMDTSKSRDERIAAFHQRAGWLRQLPNGVTPAATWMVEHFGRQGMVARHPGPADLPEIPDAVWVEALPPASRATARQAHATQQALIAEARQGPGSSRWAEAGWSSPEEAKAASLMRRHGS